MLTCALQHVHGVSWALSGRDNSFLSYVYSKQPIFGLTQEWFRELSFSRLECGVHDKLQHHTSLDAKLHVACHSHHFGGGILISRAYRRRPCGYLKDLRTPSVVSCDSGHGVRNAIYLINSKILLTKPHSGIAVLMLSYLLPIRWQGHAVVSDHTVSNILPTTPNHTCRPNYNINILVGLGQRFIQQRWSGNPKLARTIPFI